MPDYSPEEELIIKILEEPGEMGYKELNEKFSETYEGCRLILKKLKEKGVVNYDGMIPGFASIITFVKPEDREGLIQEMRGAHVEVKKPRGVLNDEQEFIMNIIEEHEGEIGYKELNERYSEKYEGLRLQLKKLKEWEYVNFDGMIPSFDSVIKKV
ncbi:MAG: hypothetical protein ACFFCS_15630 [Candidatus Hodarchaeota archaeon]